MELSSRLQEAVVEVYSKKYSVSVDNSEVCFSFEKKFGGSTGVVCISIGEKLFSRVNFEFNTAENLVLSERFTLETLVSDANFGGTHTKEMVTRGIKLLKQYIAPECEDTGINDILEDAANKNEHNYQLLIKQWIPEFSADTISFHPNMIFKKDIVCDELIFIEFIMAVESSFDIDIPDDDLDGDITYGQLLSMIQSVKRKIK